MKSKGNKIRLSDLIAGDLTRKKTDTEDSHEPTVKRPPSFRLSSMDGIVFKEKSSLAGSAEAGQKDPDRGDIQANTIDQQNGSQPDSFRFKDLMDFGDQEEKSPSQTAMRPADDIPQDDGENKEGKTNARPFGSKFEADTNDLESPAGEYAESDLFSFEHDSPCENEMDRKAESNNSRILFSRKDAGPDIPALRAVEVEDPGKIYESARAYLQQVKENVKHNKLFTIDPALNLVWKIVSMPDLIDRIYGLTVHVHHEEDYNISHQVNTMIYALKMGVGFSFPEKRLLELSVAALLHDVGMFLIPDNITGKSGKLTDGDLSVIKKHPELGRNILAPHREQHPWLLEVAYQHHERENGQGYPRGLSGPQISEYAKIIGIVDSYEAMTHNRPYRKALMQAFSAKELIKSKNSLFAPGIIKVFLKVITLYPLGSYVRLNNKAIGRVFATDKARPLRPDIQILFNSEGQRINEEIILKLDENPIFFIQDSLSEDELPGKI